MKNVPWFLVAVFVLASCGPAAKLRKAEKLIAKAEELGAKWKVDTVLQPIHVPVPQVYVKEIHHALPGDTVTIEKERLKIKLVKIPGDSIFVEGECESDTVVIRTPVTVTKTIQAKGGLQWWWLIVAASIGLLVGFFRK
jgi:hypothetical protein